MGERPAGGEGRPSSFIVRCWPHRSAERGETVWRGEVVHVETGRKAAFQGLARVAEVLEGLMQSLLSASATEGSGDGPHKAEGVGSQRS